MPLLPFIEAIAWARARQVVLPQTYYGELQGLARAMAFSIAGLAKLDQLTQIQDSLAANLETGESFNRWKQRVAAGEIPLDLPGHRLDNIYRTNIQGHYNRGRCEQQGRNVERRPYYLYDAVNDSRTRPGHAAMDGFVARHDDPMWGVWTPTNGYRCRCRRIALTEDQAERYRQADQRRIRDSDESAAARAGALFNGPDEGWDYSVCDEPTRGLRRAIERKRQRCGSAELAAGAPCHDAARGFLDDLAKRLEAGAPLAELIRTALGGRYKKLAVESQGPALEMGLTLEQAISLRAYSRYDISRLLNRILWFVEGRGIKLPANAERWAPLIQGMDEALIAMPSYEGVTLRGIGLRRLPADFIRAHKAGEYVRYFGYTGTSRQGGERMPWEDWMLHFCSHGGRLIEKASLHPDQREVLIPRGSLFRVADVNEERRIMALEGVVAAPRNRRVWEFSL